MPRKNRKNWEIAYNYFVSEGLIPQNHAKNEYVLHHIDDTLKTQDPVRYYEWRIEDLQPMLRSEHTSMHQNGVKRSTEYRERLSNSLKGHVISEETKAKISRKLKGKSGAKTSSGLKKYYETHHPWNYGKSNKKNNEI